MFYVLRMDGTGPDLERLHERALREQWSLEELDSEDGRDRLLRMIEGFQLAFSKRGTSR